MYEAFTLAAGAKITKPGGGELFLFAESLTGKVEVTYRLRMSDGTPVVSAAVFSEQDQYEFIAPLLEMTVHNISGASNDVVLRGGFAKYHPRVDAGQVSIVGTVDTTGSTVDIAGPVDVTGSSVSVTGPVSVTPDASGTGGATPARIIAAAGTNTTAFLGGPGKIYTLNGANVTAGALYLKLYDQVAAPNLAVDVPAMTIPLPPGAFSFDFGTFGAQFPTAIAYAITGGLPDADVTPIAAGDVVASLTYSS